MASFAAACRVSARVAGNRAGSRVAGFTTSARCLAAQNFVMPALSPTMTEGNIASWKVKEGDSFSVGDVLLEIETDKATMDVEAQDDGILMKVMSQDGSKAVQVGTRIAVLAEAGDDISALEIPAHEDPKQSAASQQDSTPSTSEAAAKPSGSNAGSVSSTSTETHKQIYPLLPSVGHLIKEKGLSDEDVSRIQPTGPNGRLLKGDVLAFIGSISPDTPQSISSRFDKLSHLDLSNIKVAEKKAAPAPAKDADTPAAEPIIEDIEISVPVSLTKVVEVQKKIQDTLGVFLPLSTFISRASAVANDDLPPTTREPSADELFDQVLGLDKVKAAKGTRGIYTPQISAVRPTPAFAAEAISPKKEDIIDLLAPKAAKKATSPLPSVTTVPGLSTGANVFTLVVPEAEEERAESFLSRCKLILEEEPGRLVL